MPIGPLELVIILVIIVLIFGANKFKDLGKSAGEGIREFKTSVKTDDEKQQPEIRGGSTVDGEIVGETSEPISERRA